MIRVCVAGYGYWGPNLVRNFAEAAGSKVTWVCDLSPKRLAKAQARYPAIRTTSRFQEILDAPDVDAVAIATPVSTHFDLVLQALRAGKHVLVEKPLASSSRDAAILVEEAERRRLVLMVDHTFLYTGAVRKMRELIQSEALGRIYYYDSVRVNLGLFQHDVNVIWDLAVHDLSIMDHLLKARPLAVSATGMSHVPGQPENIAYLTYFFENSLLAHIHVNWLAPVKVRRTLIGGSLKMIVYDDLEASEKIKVYDRGITVAGGGAGPGAGPGASTGAASPAAAESDETKYRMLIGYRAGDMWAPNYDMTEALQQEVEHFNRCIENGEKPLSDGEAGLRIVRFLEAASLSLKEQGRPVEFKVER